jgi:hypothetical protein
MGLFRKKSKAKRPDTNRTSQQVTELGRLKGNANRKRRSKIDENILRSGPDTGFVWHEDA